MVDEADRAGTFALLNHRRGCTAVINGRLFLPLGIDGLYYPARPVAIAAPLYQVIFGEEIVI
jgi:hypothetical protein